MNMISLSSESIALIQLMLDALIKSAVILSIAGLLAVSLRKASAASRHLVWSLAMASLLALPAEESAWQRQQRRGRGQPGGMHCAAAHQQLGFADVSARGKLQLSGAVDHHVRFLTGNTLEPLHTAPVTSGGLLARIARDWGLALLEPSAERDVMLGLAERETDHALATDVTSALSGFLVAGPLLPEFLERTVHEDLSGVLAGRCAAASWARIPAVLVMKDLASPAVEIYVSSDHGRYAWEVLQRLGGTPIGWRALEQWGWR